eukprot:4700256-Prymnesium_polylepis.1
MGYTDDSPTWEAEARTAASATANGRIAGALNRLRGRACRDSSKATLERARELVATDEVIFAVFEASSSQGCRARWQGVADSLAFPPCLALYMACGACAVARETALAHDRSFFVVTDRHIYKEVWASCKQRACAEGACCRYAFGCCLQLQGSDDGKVALIDIKEVDWGDTLPNTVCGGQLCLPVAHVLVRVERGHVLATYGRTAKRWRRSATLPSDRFVMLVRDASEAAAIVRTAIRSAKEREGVEPQRIEREKQGVWSDDFYWVDLTAEQRAAAQVLGYDKKRWNNDMPVPAEDKVWNALTTAEREAAAMLGYNRLLWDDPDLDA